MVCGAMAIPSVSHAAELEDSGNREADWLRTEPLRVNTEQLGSDKRLRVDWGTSAEVLSRDPRRVAEDLAALRTEWTSPERIAQLQAEWERLIPVEREAGRQQYAEYRRLREQVAQDPGVPRRLDVVTREEEVPAWLRNLPWEFRRSLILGVFDSRDAEQVAWALAQTSAHPEIELVAVGWESHKSLDDLVAEHPRLRHQRVQTVAQGPNARSAADWTGDYGIDSLPALVSFPTSTEIRLVEGVGDVAGGE